MFYLSAFEDDICVVGDHSDTSTFPFGSRDSTPSKVLIDISKFPCSFLYMRVAHHGSPSQCHLLYHFSSLVGMNIVNALK